MDWFVPLTGAEVFMSGVVLGALVVAGLVWEVNRGWYRSRL